MVAKKVGAGAVVAVGIGRTCNGGITYTTQRWTDGELDVLLDSAFQWMVENARKVLWYGSERGTYSVYNEPDRCSNLIAALFEKGYIVEDKDIAPITSSLLNPYDILILPGLQVGTGTPDGGDPDLFPDADVTAIVDFVEGGGGLFLMESGDYDGFCFHRVSNKILEALKFGFFYQHDTIADPETDTAELKYVTVDVNTDTEIGAAYEAETGKTTIKLYKVPSLTLPMPGVTVEIAPKYHASMPGSTLIFSVTVTNTGEDDDSYALTVSDNAGWVLNLENESLLNVPGPNKSKDTTLMVTIPSDTAIGIEDNITITATSTVNDGVSGSGNCVARAAMQIIPPTDDTYTHEGRPDTNWGGSEDMYVGWYEHPTTGVGGPERVWLKFDLSILPAGASVSGMRLWIYNGALTGWGSNGVQVYRVENDDWSEGVITWSNQPTIGELLDEPKAVTETGWYSWDVSDFALQELAGDKKFSLCLLDNEESVAQDHSTWFRTKEYDDIELWPYLELVPPYKVDVSISPPWVQDNSPGGTLTYAATVNNLGVYADNYSLTVGSTRGWGVAITPDQFTDVQPDESRIATLTVTIPSDAQLSTKDTITVTATGTGVSESATCRAHAFEGVKLPTIADLHVSEGQPDTVYGGENTLCLQSGTDINERMFLKFDLSAIPSEYTIIDAEVWLWCRNAEFADLNAQCLKVLDDAGVNENLVTWGTQPTYRDVLSTVALSYLPPSKDMWHSWNVTSFVQDEFEGNKIASFCIRAEEEGANGMYQFSSKEWPIENQRPHLKITYTTAPPPTAGVEVSVLPLEKSGSPGESTTFTVNVTNTGDEEDTFELTADPENADWTTSISPASLTLAGGASGTVTLTISIPDGASEGDSTTITVAATGTGYDDTATCTARAEAEAAFPWVYVGVAVVILIIIVAAIVVMR